MRYGSVIVVVLSLLAIAAAAHFGVSTPTTSRVSCPTANVDVSVAIAQPTPLRAATHTAPSIASAEPADPRPAAAARSTSPATATEESVREDSDLPTRRPLCRRDWDEVAGQDQVALAIATEIQRLAGFTDDLAVEYADMSDDEYRHEQALQRERFESGPLTPPTSLPDRERPDVDAWVRVAERCAARDRADGVPRADFELSEIRAFARRYKIEVARLQPESLREYARDRHSRRRVVTAQEAWQYANDCVRWKSRKATWVEADPEREDDARELEELVRSMPSRNWFPPAPDDLKRILAEPSK